MSDENVSGEIVYTHLAGCFVVPVRQVLGRTSWHGRTEASGFFCALITESFQLRHLRLCWICIIFFIF